MGLIKRGTLKERGTLYIRENVPQIERQAVVLEPEEEQPQVQTESQAELQSPPELPQVEIPDEVLNTETGTSGEEAVSYAKAEAE